MATFANILTPIYCTPTQVRRVIGTNTQSTNDDDILLYFCEQASRRIDVFCNRRFYIYSQTMLLDWPGTSFTLYLPEDLHTVTTLVNGDGNTIPKTITIGGSTVIVQYLYPAYEYPKWKLELGINSSIVFLYVGTPQQALSLTALFGYPAVENTGQYYMATSATVQDAVSQTASATTLTTQTGNFQAGQTILVDSEFELIQGVSVGATNDTLTVLRGAAGSTAAIHTNGTAINLCVYNPDIVHAAYRLAGYLYRQKDSGVYDTIGIQQMGTLTIPSDIPQDIRAILKQYIRTSR